MKFRMIFACVLALGVVGCANDRLIGRPDLKIVDGADLPPPGRQDLMLQQRSYVVGPLDRVTVEVYGVPELSRTVQVDSTGHITLPLLGSIDAAGKTTEEIGSLVGDRLRDKYVRDPQVIIGADTVNQLITVDGQVKKPGVYPVSGRMTLIRAVATAEGMDEFADVNYIVVFRQVDGKKMAAMYDMRAIRQGQYPDPEVYANDVVFVGTNGAAQIFQDLIKSAPLLTVPLIALLN